MNRPCTSKRMRLERNESPAMQGKERESADFAEKIIKSELDDEQEEIKLEPAVENIKEELLDDEYFERNIPKLEPGIEESETATSASFFNYDHENSQSDDAEYNKFDVTMETRQYDEWLRLCQLCDKIEDLRCMKLITTESAKLVMISVFFEDPVKNKQAMKFLKAGEYCRVCFSHFPEIVAKIQEHCRRPILREKLMPTVNFFLPEVTLAEFRYFSMQFIVQHTSVVNMKRKEQDQPPPDFEYKPSKILNNSKSASQKSGGSMENCGLCAKSVNRKQRKYVKHEEERLVLAVFYNEFSNPDQAMKFMNGNIYAYVCCTHYPELVDRVQEYPRYEDDIEELMKTVHLFRPYLKNTEFLCIMDHFIRKNQSSVSSGRQLIVGSRICSVCKKLTVTRDFSYVTSIPVRLVIMVGCILRGTHSIENAKLFIASKKTIPVCHTHFTDSVNQIYTSLEIEDHRNMLICGRELMQNFMKLVNVLCPDMRMAQFHNIITSMKGHATRLKVAAVRSGE